MNKIVSILAIGLLLAATAFAADAEYSFREGVRTGIVTSIFDSAVAFVGDITVASNATVTGTTIVNAIDADGVADIHYGSADVTDHTFTSDGGTVILDGDITFDTLIFADAATAAPTNSLSAGVAVTVNGTNYWLGLYPAND